MEYFAGKKKQIHWFFFPLVTKENGFISLKNFFRESWKCEKPKCILFSETRIIIIRNPEGVLRRHLGLDWVQAVSEDMQVPGQGDQLRAGKNKPFSDAVLLQLNLKTYNTYYITYNNSIRFLIFSPFGIIFSVKKKKFKQATPGYRYVKWGHMSSIQL